MVGEPERHRRGLEEVAALYDWLDSQLQREPARAGRCRACGACCNFQAYDHRLFVTPPELIYLAAKLDTEKLRSNSAGPCPYQQGTECAVHEHRFAGCRIFCCNGDADFQSDLSEAVLRRLKALCAQWDIPYRYQELAAALAGFSDTCRLAGAPGPADCED